MTWEKIKEYGYGLLDLHPDTLFSLTIHEFMDMVEAKLSFLQQEKDDQLEWASWFVANIMMASGNMKKGTKPMKVARGLYVPLEERKKEAEKQKEKHLSEAEVQQQREALLQKFGLQK